MPIISAVRLFCCDKFEETPNEKVVNMSKLTKPYFNNLYWAILHILFSENLVTVAGRTIEGK